MLNIVSNATVMDPINKPTIIVSKRLLMTIMCYCLGHALIAYVLWALKKFWEVGVVIGDLPTARIHCSGARAKGHDV
jgi:uncharacterized membrane protein